MTAGCLTFEIEYGSDFTYRFYDFGRGDENGNNRELHIDKALKSIKTQEKPQCKKVPYDDWISEQNYEIKIITSGSDYINESEGIELISIIDGKGRDGEIPLSSGMGVILMPGEHIENLRFNKIVIARLRR